jgi:hypothetical protein
MNGVPVFIQKFNPYVWAILNILLLHFLLPLYPWLVATFAILGVTIFFQYRKYFLLLTSVLYVLTFCTENSYFDLVAQKLNFNITMVTVSAMTIYFLSLALMFLYKKYVLRFQISLLFLSLILLRVFITQLESRYIILILISFFFFIKMHFWYFVFGPNFSKENFISYLFCVTNPAQSVYLIPTSPNLFIESKKTDQFDLARLQKRSALSLLGILILRLAYKFITETTSLTGLMENIHGENILGFISFKHYGVFQNLQTLFQDFGNTGIFISIITMGLLVISNAVIFCGIAISFYMSVGFDLPPFIKVFWNSKYFHRMLSQLMPYYNRAIIDIFYSRIHNLLTYLKLHKFSFLSIYLTIAVGGVSLSLWKNLFRSNNTDIISELLKALDGSSYFFIVAMLSVFSWYRERKNRKLLQVENKWGFMYFIVYLFLFTVLLNARMLTHRLHFSYENVLKAVGL